MELTEFWEAITEKNRIWSVELFRMQKMLNMQIHKMLNFYIMRKFSEITRN